MEKIHETCNLVPTFPPSYILVEKGRLIGVSLSKPQFSDADGTFVRVHKFA